MENYKMIAGIDVSKLKLDVYLMKNPNDPGQKHFIVSNNEKGIKEIIKTINKQGDIIEHTLFCFENTGVYSMSLSYVLSEMGIDYWVVNALEIKRSKGLTRGKNDKNDAKDIAVYASVNIHKLKLSSIPEKEIAQLKMLYSEREKLIRAIKLMDSTKEVKGFLPDEVIKDTIRLNARTIKFLKKQLQELEQKMQNIINNTEKIKEQYDLITSIPGVGKQTAIYLINTTQCFESFKNWRQLACYAGVAPFEYSSGSSIRGRTKVSHLADKKMKSLLNMCALSIKKSDKQIAEYYQKKLDEGKNPMLIMNNIRCKILSRVFAVVNRGTKYVNFYKFAE